jgi:hypothetical protein
MCQVGEADSLEFYEYIYLFFPFFSLSLLSMLLSQELMCGGALRERSHSGAEAIKMKECIFPSFPYNLLFEGRR